MRSPVSSRGPSGHRPPSSQWSSVRALLAVVCRGSRAPEQESVSHAPTAIEAVRRSRAAAWVAMGEPRGGPTSLLT